MPFAPFLIPVMAGISVPRVPWSLLSQAGAVGNPAGTVTTSGTPINTVGADLIFVITAALGMSVTDNAANSWGSAVYSSGVFTPEISVYAVRNPVTSATHTFTAAGGAYSPIVVLAYAGSAIRATPDQAVQGAPNSLASITPTTSNQLILCGGAASIAGPYTATGSGFAVVQQVGFVDGNSWGLVVGSFVQPIAATIAAPVMAGPGGAVLGGSGIMASFFGQ